MTVGNNNLLPLAPKGSLPFLLNTRTSNKPIPLSAVAPLDLNAQPRSLLLNSDVLVRASLTDSLLNVNGSINVDNARMNLVNRIAQAQVEAHQQHLKQQLHHQLLQLQAAAAASQQTTPRSPQVAAKSTGIIGMGINIPNPLPLNTSARTSTASKPPKPSSSLQKMMKIGNPLRAPPPLCSEIQKRPASDGEAAPETKRRKIAPLMTTDQLEFLKAAQRLHDISNDPSPAQSPLYPPKNTPAPLMSKALRPPPALGL